MKSIGASFSLLAYIPREDSAMVRHPGRRMNSIATTLVLAALAAASVHATHAAGNSNAVALVRAMRADEIAVATAKLAFLSGSVEQRYGKTKAGCVKRVPYENFTARWARVVETVLSPQEIDTSLTYFQSEAGVKYVEGLLRRMRSREGADAVFPEVPGKENISPAQQAAIADFSRSDTGRKLMGKDLTASPAAVDFGRAMMDEIARSCGQR
jgi:hypothetical protein